MSRLTVSSGATDRCVPFLCFLGSLVFRALASCFTQWPLFLGPVGGEITFLPFLNHASLANAVRNAWETLS